MSYAAFYSALSGLQSNQTRLSVIGNNLANTNTIGFKSSRATFHDFFSGAAFNGAGNPAQVGRGVNIASIDPLFSQGSLQTTNLFSDFAIQGRGFFVLANDRGGLAYSRAGNFNFDKDGNLVASSGMFVQGFSGRDLNGNILTSGPMENVRIPTGLIAPPNTTTRFDTRINLNANMDADFIATLTVFDSLGERHAITVNFTPVDTDSDGAFDTWNYEVTAEGDEVVGGTAGTPFVLDSGTVTFDANGQLTAPAGTVALTIPGWNNGAGAQPLDWELYDAEGNGLLTGYASPSAIFSTTQDGFGAGELRTVLVDPNGLISGIFTNGVNLPLARMALAIFNNDAGLLRDGRNNYLETTSSGTPTIGSPNSGGRGVTLASSLELSNVDITQEFTDLIISQRGYQANSRIITTSDELIQEALSLKR